MNNHYSNADLAQFLYEEYCCFTDFKSAVTGAQLPQWSDVVLPVRNAWIATAKALNEKFEVTRRA